ncbi:hypothetical protein CPB85DRAFT_1289743 [Mucidula mucida]|nr:hypothetical protein CPB85DRAFT_1289743 [Mucidula mucida]
MSTKTLNDLIQSLPKALRPPSDKSNGLSEGFVSVIEAIQSFNQLPPGLKARLGVHYSPPQFDFGWLIDIAGLISTLQASHPDCLVYATIEDGMTGDKRQVLDQRDTFARVQEELGIATRWTLCLEDTLEIEDDGVRCLTLTDSYVNGNETPEMDVIELVKNFFVGGGAEVVFGFS